MSDIDRRTALAALGAAGVLAGCRVYGKPAAAKRATKKSTGPGGTPAGLAKTTDIPAGGGTIFGDDGVVVTQPVAGTFRCFSAICTHAGCTVATVQNGTINCACHGSEFRITDGSVARGPASTPLERRNITVANGQISLA